MSAPSHATLGLGGIALASAAILLIVLLMEHVGGLEPCPLCYQQRYAYYAALPAAALGLMRPSLARPLLAALALGFLGNAGFGFWHMGIEYGWWAGPASCGGEWALPATTQDLMRAMGERAPADCASPAWRLLGVSLAGYNMLASLGVSLWAGWFGFGVRYGKTD